MNQRDLSVWLVPILAMLAIYFPVASSRSPEVGANGSALQSVGPLSKSRANGQHSSAARLLSFYLGGDSRDLQKRLSDHDIRFLIATVPDPTDSALGHLFDAHVAAIQRAAEAAEYVLDRFELP